MKKRHLLIGFISGLVALFTATSAMAQSQITMKTKKAVGATVQLEIKAEGDFTVEGATLKGENQYELSDVEGNIVIKGDIQSLVCASLELTELDVTQAPNLTSLDCKGNRLYSLNLSENKKLRNLSCSSNKIGRLELATDGNLETIDCSKNELKGGGMQLFLGTLPERENTEVKGKFMVINNEEAPDGNILTQYQVNATKKKGWLPQEWNKAQNKWIDYAGTEHVVGKGVMTLTTTKKKGETFTLTIGFMDCVHPEHYEVEGGEVVDAINSVVTYRLTNEQGRITIKGDLSYLICMDNQITALDVSNNPQLKRLICGKNLLKTLDVSALPYLEDLDCCSNELSTLDVSHNPLLSSLHCDNNNLSSLDVRANKELRSLSCYNNRLSTIDLSRNPKLYFLICSRNQISTLDFSHNPNMEYVDCSQNNINGEAMDALIASLVDRVQESQKGEFRVVNTKRGDEKNICTKKQVAALKARGWIAKAYKKEGDSWVEYPGNDVAIDEVLASEGATIVAIYSVDGRRLAELQQGVNIVCLSNGKTRKILVSNK
ncbi:leucine-rich repeat domain-containing protein [Porphyromonas circumdentaria]|uniref:leucine-rich repeat domain-containing protein n=1 Tax=Porphyromonas circumdentaria TaxID=29524 RepID=UPI0026DC31F7|nr:hypothetical protein [Porphyromonas circumdentaria]MDO4722924.1 hypothetical protein [Porphyromonas circumdentaria]